MTPEIAATIITLVVGILVRLIDHYWPHLVDNVRPGLDDSDDA